VNAVAGAVACVWLGMVLAISFLEAPLKFRAPGVTLALGLGIGRVVFAALNRVEVVLGAAVLLAAALGPQWSRPRQSPSPRSWPSSSWCDPLWCGVRTRCSGVSRVRVHVPTTPTSAWRPARLSRSARWAGSRSSRPAARAGTLSSSGRWRQRLSRGVVVRDEDPQAQLGPMPWPAPPLS
jgi:hypothetical protein